MGRRVTSPILLAWCVLLGLVGPLAAQQEPATPEPTPIEVRARLAVVTDADADVADRTRASEWLRSRATSAAVWTIAPQAEAAVEHASDPKLRAELVGLCATVAFHARQPCPLVVVQSLLDDETGVAETARTYAGLFEEYHEGSEALLLRALRMGGPAVRSCVVGCLAAFAERNDSPARKALTGATGDASFRVRHNARVTLFKVTEDFVPFATYLLDLQADPDGAVAGVDRSTEEGRTEVEIRDLALIASATFFATWADSRPSEVATILHAALADDSADKRCVAARLVGACYRKVDFEGDFAPQRSRAADVFDEKQSLDILRELATDDPDVKVRAAAMSALQRIRETDAAAGMEVDQ